MDGSIMKYSPGIASYKTTSLSFIKPCEVGSALRLCLAGPSPRSELLLARADWPAFMREAWDSSAKQASHVGWWKMSGEKMSYFFLLLRTKPVLMQHC